VRATKRSHWLFARVWVCIGIHILVMLGFRCGSIAHRPQKYYTRWCGREKATAMRAFVASQTVRLPRAPTAQTLCTIVRARKGERHACAVTVCGQACGSRAIHRTALAGELECTFCRQLVACVYPPACVLPAYHLQVSRAHRYCRHYLLQPSRRRHRCHNVFIMFFPACRLRPSW
jgi:hypothetical protein